ncbi:DUF3102 domain-containing protein [Desulfitobacterium hafniense]|uniref:Preprotein translocase subunit SecA n=5 Tax=root TaxID=1 RepID=Q24WT1_DESHY|nr:DUF3102 domain-containing protein [Desulfitobacterium hafniense]ACL20892.1 conserved hypothetical protein [Desulfitobacterium hafniense DCB-2]EHL04767.1 hypothetical protein HMPREF0322_04548 [Desulfitobacterium hafniense DP7]MEA5025367.1 DUF3102 domain-containing protein [Desulfitobacterium hafniense]CDX01777.1 Membrane-bound metallopeptidase [Desulfitobacterium hafniense]BAE83511.1 hypothetical protein DSY1722 [Desulfitobacterium hafniense Y51]
MNPINTERTTSNIAAEILIIRQHTCKILLVSAVEIGKRLKEAKALLPHGEWLKWLAESVSYSRSTAGNLMRLHGEYGPRLLTSSESDENCQSVGNLTYTQALILLGLPEEEREQFMAEHDVAGMSKVELQQAVQERDQAREERDRAIGEKSELEKEVADKDSRITELTTRNAGLEQEVSDYKQKDEARPEKVVPQPKEPAVAKEESPSARKIADVQFTIHRDNMLNAYEGLLKTLAGLADTDPQLKEEYRETAYKMMENMTKRLKVYPPAITTNLKIKKITTTL